MPVDKKPLTTIRQLQSRLSGKKEMGLISSFHSPNSSKNPHPGKWVLNGEPYEDIDKFLITLVSRNVINGTEMNAVTRHLAGSEPEREVVSSVAVQEPDTRVNEDLKASLRRIKGRNQLMELDVECLGMLHKLVTQLKDYVTLS